MLRVLYLIIAIVSLGLFLGGPLLAFLKAVPGSAGFALMAAGCLLGILVVLIGIAVLANGGSKITVTAMLLGLAPAIFALFGLISAGQYPLINDVSTDLDNPPDFVDAAQLPENASRDMAFPVDNRDPIASKYAHLKPLRLTDPPDAVYGRALRAIDTFNWVLVTKPKAKDELASDSTDPLTVEGYAVSDLFGFHDDFVVRITPAEKGCVVDMRSKSREGKGDFGANAKRIVAFLEAIDS